MIVYRDPRFYFNGFAITKMPEILTRSHEIRDSELGVNDSISRGPGTAKAVDFMCHERG